MTPSPVNRVAAFAPGRVNLIGEHTDYNGDLCLPFAIDLGVTVTAEPIDGRELIVRALDRGEEDSFEPGEANRPQRGWGALAPRSATELAEAGVELRPARLEISSSLPAQGGLSSSAA